MLPLEISTQPFNGTRPLTRPVLKGLLAVGSMLVASYANSATPSADRLTAKFAALKNNLSSNPFQRPLTLDSAESSNLLKGDVYALINHPFQKVNTALQVPSNWCDILILHLNTKYCKATVNENNQMLNVYFGKKTQQSLEDAYGVELDYQVKITDPNYLGVELRADKGPVGTSNYLISLEAIPVGNNQSFIHLTYSYALGLTGGLATRAYLASSGRDKIGFTPVKAKGPKQLPSSYIGGVRGMLERNTMRYYLAIDTYLGAMNEPANKRFNLWFSATEHYPHQLQEISRNAYLSMKQAELRRMREL